jgi:hypothetical protein
MGKNKNRNQSGQEGASAAPRSRAAHHHPTFIERLIGAADTIHAKATMLAAECVKKGVPEETTQVARDFIPLAEKYREVFFGLKESGWAPPAKASQVTISEGDKIAIRPEAQGLYDYIHNVDGSPIKLVAGQVTVSGKRVQVLLLGEDGHPYGRATRSHLMLR